MPDQRQHRGAHPADSQLFAAGQVERLRTAADELSWLLTRGYATRSSLQLVGDRHSLVDRQRLAISRAACPDAQRAQRSARCMPVDAIEGADVFIDGFNLIITTEAGLGGGVLLRCRDDCIRDLSSVHGSYRSVAETDQAIELISQLLAGLQPRSVHWFLDKPVSNSGRLAQRIRDLATLNNWNWTVEVVMNPDGELAEAPGLVITSDSVILDRGVRWVNFNDHLLRQIDSAVWLVNLSPGPATIATAGRKSCA